MAVAAVPPRRALVGGSNTVPQPHSTALLTPGGEQLAGMRARHERGRAGDCQPTKYAHHRRPPWDLPRPLLRSPEFYARSGDRLSPQLTIPKALQLPRWSRGEASARRSSDARAGLASQRTPEGTLVLWPAARGGGILTQGGLLGSSPVAERGLSFTPPEDGHDPFAG